MHIPARVLLSIASIFATVAIVVGASFAFFSDTETSQDNTLQAGALDLLVNNQNDPEGIVNLTDLKPGDNQTVDKDLYVDFNPAIIYLHLIEFESSQGTSTEPEVLEENGTPKHDIENYIDYDLKIVANTDNNIEEDVIIDVSDQIPFTDVFSCWIPIGQIPGATHVTLQQSFHFDPTVTNWAQGDQIVFSEEFYASQINDPNGPPPTGSGRVWNPQTLRCEDDQIVLDCETPFYASNASNNNQGKRKDGTNVLADRTNPASMFGAPQTSGAPSDVGFPAGSFFSLGFTNGNIVLEFSEPFYPNPSGNDLFVYEVTGGVYPDENVKVEVGPTAAGPWTIATPNPGTRDAGFEMNTTSAQFVRLTEFSNINLFETTADGYDVDAVRAFCTEAE